MGQAVPALRIQDRSIVLRMIKLVGRVLAPEGRSVRSVPLVGAGTRHSDGLAGVDREVEDDDRGREIGRTRDQ